jgi:copper transport protein
MRPSRTIVLLGLAVLWLVWVSPVAAHADLVWSDPADGGVYSDGVLSQISLQFDETLEPRFSNIEVYDSRLKRVDLGELQVDINDPHLIRKALDVLSKGDYTVLWNVVSTADGHATTGLFQFRVGEGEGSPFPPAISTESNSDNLQVALEVVIRWFLLVSALVAFGALFFIPGVLHSNSRYMVGTSFETAISEKTSRLASVAVILWLATNCAFLFWQSVSVSHRSLGEAIGSGVPLTLLQTRLGLIWSLRQIVAVGLLMLCWRVPVGRFKIKIILAAIMLATISLTSHGAANALWPTFAVLLDWFHLLANATWLGGLVTLALVFIPIWRRSSRETEELFEVVRRFSKVAVIAIVIAATTGVYAATLHFLEPVDIMGTSYGRILLLKLVLVGVVLSIGLANQRAVRHKSGKLVSGVTREFVVGGLILLATAALTALPTPPPQILATDDIPFNGQLHQITLPEDDLQAFVSLAPNYIGWNRTMVVIQDSGGLPITNAQRVRVRFSLQEVDARTDWRVMTPAENGLYITEGHDMVLVGDWQVEVDVRRDSQPDTRFSLDWPLSAPPTVKVDPSQPRPVNWLALGLVGLVAVILLFRVARSRILAKDEIWPLGRLRRI